MYRIVVNQARNKYRWNRRRGAHLHISINQELDNQDLNNLYLDLPDKTKTPDDDLAFREWERDISEEVKNLPAVNREALVLRNVKNLSYEQISELLNCKVGTVKSRIARARDELRRRLGM
jgi:RNA polymerase sigma-70 factor (ECF subfamily)